MAAHAAGGGFARAGAVRRVERSYPETLAWAGGVAAGLRRKGVRPGDRVILMTEDGPQWIAGFAGCLAVGAVTVPLEAGVEEGFLEAVARRCGARVLLHDAGRHGRPFDGAAIDLEALDRPDRVLLEPVADPDPDDLAEIVFTSGTTAAPRGVMITHRNILTAFAGIEEGIRRRRRKLSLVGPFTILSLVPLSHLFGQALGFFIPSLLGARVVFSPTRPPRALLRVAKREKAWVMVLVPRHLAALREYAAGRVAPPGERLSPRWWVRALRSQPLIREHGWRMRTLVVGGARLDPDLERFFKDLGYLVVQGYGLTETAPVVSVSNPFDNRVGLVGKPSRAQEVRLAADGEILIRGGNVTPGYYEDPDSTRESLEGEWLHTGDLGAMEPDGTLRILGRKKEVIVTGEGQNVFPDEVEAALRREEAIADAAVFALLGERGEVVHAAVIPERQREGTTGALAAAVAAVNERLAPHQRVRGWSTWNDLDFPRTPTGKVIRRVVAAAVREARTLGKAAGEGAGRAAAGPEEAAPLDLLRKLAGPEARDDQRFGADLGVSSIDVAELTAAIEDRYQVEIDPARIHDDASLGDLLTEARAAAEPQRPWPMPRWARSLPGRLARSLLQTIIVSPGLRTFVRLRCAAPADLSRVKPPFLIAANHASHLDVPILILSLPRSLRRRVAVAMQPEYFEPYIRRTGSLLTRLHMGWHYTIVSLLLHTFPFPRSAAFRVALEYAGELVDGGWSILVFPEGELSREGDVHAFRPGVGVLARELGLPVLPARIRGAFDVLPRGHRFPCTIRGPVTVTWGEPLSLRAGEEPREFAARLEQAIRAL